MLLTKKPADGTKLNFPKMGALPAKKPFKPVKAADVENAADAKKPGDKKEDAPKSKKKNNFKKGQSGNFALKAAKALAAKK